MGARQDEKQLQRNMRPYMEVSQNWGGEGGGLLTFLVVTIIRIVIFLGSI